MVTPLQAAFANSNILRRGIADLLAAEGLPYKGYKKLWRSVIAETFAQMPETKIKLLLYDFWTCDDITAADRAEILRLLQLSTTALTEEQRRQLADI